MASHSAALISRSLQHLLRRPALSSLACKSILARPFPVNSMSQDPIFAGGAPNLEFSGRLLDIAFFGRFDLPAIDASQRASTVAKNSDRDEDLFEEEDEDEFDDGEDLSDDFVDEEEDEEEDGEEKKPTKSKRS